MTFSTLGTDTQTKQPVYLYKASRTQGTYILGATGTGKSGLLENLIIQDIEQDLGVCLLDPHGDLTVAVLSRLPDRRKDDVILLDLLDTEYPFGLNLYQCDDLTDDKTFSNTRSQVLHVFGRLWGDRQNNYELGVWIARYLRNSATALIKKGYTMAELPLLFTNKKARLALTAGLTDYQDSSFWEEYNDLRPDEQHQRYETNLSRADAFLSDRIMYNIVGQAKTTIDLLQIINERKILLVKLARRHEEMTSLIGSVIVAFILNAMYSPLNKRKQFHLYADEFQLFATKDFATLLAEARKFGIGTTIAHQFRDQLDQDNKGATLTAANMIVFRVSSTDADELAGQFDITPQAAWEQMIEEESVQVLKEEWFEPITDVIEDGVEEIKTPVSTPFDWLLSHTHDNPVVSKFADGTLRKIHIALSSEYAKDKRAELNSFLYRAMTSPDPLSFLCEKSSLSFLLRLNDWYPIGTYYFGETVIAGLPELATKTVTSNTEYKSFLSIPNQRVKPEYILVSMPLLAAKRRSEGGKIDYSVVDETMISALASMIRAIGDNEFHYASELFARLAQLKLKILKETYIAAYQKAYEKNSWGIPSNLKYYKYIPPEEETIRAEQEIQRWMTEERAEFETFIKEFRDFILALAKDPPETSSGLSQPRKRTQIHYLTHPRETITHPRKTILHPQRTYADMKNDMANQLVGLPDYMSRVKLKGEPEHTIQTIKPAPGLYGTVLQKRIEDIQNRNRKDRFTRPRQDVEVEIRMRQDALRQAAQPLEQKGPQSQRRLMPVCEKCGSQNQPGAKFCNQCGEKLK